MNESMRGPEGLWPEDDDPTREPQEQGLDVERDPSTDMTDAALRSDRDLEPGEGDQPVLDDPDRLQFGGRSG